MAGFDPLFPRRKVVDEIITTGTVQKTGVTGWTGQGAAPRYNAWATPIGPSSSGYIAGLQASSSNGTTSLTISNSPDYPRAVQIYPTTSQKASGNITVTGVNQWGESATDTIALGGAGSSKLTGSVAFKTISTIVMPAASSGTGTQAAVSASVGVSNIFGLDRQIASVAAAIRGAVNGTAETTAPIMNATYHTASFTTAATSSAGATVELFFLPQDTKHI